MDEAIQRRAIRIMYSCTYGMPYMCALHIADIATLASCREQLARNIFYTVTKPSSCLSCLLPAPRDPALISRLRSAPKLPRLPFRTKKYQPFISYALSHYQSA